MRPTESGQQPDSGFTLIELLVVMIIVGVLAAIAIPVFSSQRAKAQDAAAKADVSIIGKGIATYYVDATITPSGVAVSTSAGPVSNHYVLRAPAGTAPVVAAVVQDIGRASAGATVTASTQFFTDSTTWCVTVTASQGEKKNWKYSASEGMSEGICSSSAG